LEKLQEIIDQEVIVCRTHWNLCSLKQKVLLPFKPFCKRLKVFGEEFRTRLNFQVYNIAGVTDGYLKVLPVLDN